MSGGMGAQSRRGSGQVGRRQSPLLGMLAGVVRDLARPVLDGFEAMPLMLERSPGTTIVALSGFNAERMAALCIESGAHAYLEKGEDAEVIREAVLEAAVAA